MARDFSPYPARLAALQKRIASWGVSALLLTNPNDIRYLTGFSGEDSWALVLARQPRPHILSDSRFAEEIGRSAPRSVRHIRKGSLSDELKRVARALRLRKIALQSDHVTLAQRRKLVSALGAARLREVEDGLLTQRAVKSSFEIARIKKALAIQQQAFLALIPELEPGMTEVQVAAELEYLMRSLGADGVSFPTIVAADANASLPHAVPGSRKLRQGGTILIDWGARYQGYCSDLTRVLALGTMPRKVREIYQVVREAQQAGIAAIAPGRTLQEVDAAARKIIVQAGYGARFGHGLGHGIGLNIHELPTLSPRVSGVLEPGHVVTVEPGIYLPGIAGVRIEDDVLVTDRGHQVLSNLPKDLNDVVL